MFAAAYKEQNKEIGFNNKEEVMSKSQIGTLLSSADNSHPPGRQSGPLMG